MPRQSVVRLALAALLSSTSFAVAEPVSAPPAREVVVKDFRSPALKNYRAMLAGLDAFDAGRALAPDAPGLRFRLRVLPGKARAALDDLKLRIALDDGAIALPLAPDHSFVLPRNAQAARENAELLLNKPKGGFRWDPLVQSAGVPANMRRLGDLRLECQVLIAVGKEELAFWQRALANTVFLGSDWCNSDKVDLPTFSQRTIQAAWLINGATRIALPLDELGSGFIAPIRNKSYPDDTLISVDYAVEDVAAPPL